MLQKSPQIYIEFIFAVQRYENIILPHWRDCLYKCISEIITEKKQKVIIVNGMPDHIHVLVGLKPNLSMADLVGFIINGSSKFINENKFVKGKFEWQEGFGGFSCGESDLNSVYNSILNQEEFHKRVTFKQEFIEYLNINEIEFDERNLFEWIDY